MDCGRVPGGQRSYRQLNAGATLPGAKGTAKIMRMANGTTINMDLAGVTGDVNNLNLYAVDPTGGSP